MDGRAEVFARGLAVVRIPADESNPLGTCDNSEMNLV